jgi:hypothetical protein
MVLATCVPCDPLGPVEPTHDDCRSVPTSAVNVHGSSPPLLNVTACSNPVPRFSATRWSGK